MLSLDQRFSPREVPELNCFGPLPLQLGHHLTQLAQHSAMPQAKHVPSWLSACRAPLMLCRPAHDGRGPQKRPDAHHQILFYPSQHVLRQSQD